MTGKEVILYILQNDLENEIVVKDGMFLDYQKDDILAVKLGVGTATIRAMRKRGILIRV